MKPIRFTRQFQKRFKQRLGRRPEIIERFRDEVVLFQEGMRGAPINDHPLTEELAGLRAFSITDDIRVVYRETSEAYEFLDIGTHDQVYR